MESNCLKAYNTVCLLNHFENIKKKNFGQKYCCNFFPINIISLSTTKYSSHKMLNIYVFKADISYWS